MQDDGPKLTLDDPIFLGRAAERLSALIEEQSRAVFYRYGVTIPVKSCSLMAVLAQTGTATASELAAALEVSHQLVLQKVPKLLQLGLITSTPDENDARKKTFAMTPEGKAQLRRFEQCRRAIQSAYDEILREVGDLFGLLSSFTASLSEKPLEMRVKLSIDDA